MVKTSKARNKIRQFFKNQDKELSINKGREMLISQLQENGYVANKFMDKRHMDEVLQKTSYKTEEALFAAIGFGEIGAITVFNRLTEKERREEERAKAKAEAEELVKGGEVKVENKETLRLSMKVVLSSRGPLVSWYGLPNVVILFQVMISLVILPKVVVLPSIVWTV